MNMYYVHGSLNKSKTDDPGSYFEINKRPNGPVSLTWFLSYIPI